MAYSVHTPNFIQQQKLKTFGETTSLFVMPWCGSMSADMLPHHCLTNNDVILLNVLT